MVLDGISITASSKRGLFLEFSEPNIVNCTFEGNEQVGLHANRSTPTVESCLFVNNGGGHTIHRLAVHSAHRRFNLGLFGKIGENGVVKNLRLDHASLFGQRPDIYRVGLLAGETWG